MSSLKHSVICEWLNELRLLLRVGRQRLPAVHYYVYFLTCLLAFPNPNQQRSVIIILQFLQTQFLPTLKEILIHKIMPTRRQDHNGYLRNFSSTVTFQNQKNKSRFWLLFYSAPLLFNKVPSISFQSSAQNCILYFVAVSTV